MIKNIGLLSGLISAIFIVLYTLQYLLRDYYSLTGNTLVRKYINKLLPLISRHNHNFIVISFLFSVIHFLILSPFSTIINSGYVVLFILLIICKVIFFPSIKNEFSYHLNIFSYLLLASLAVHIII